MRITVTGGTGFVGAHCVRALLDGGHDVVLAVRDERKVAPALTPLGIDPSRCEVVLVDVLDADGFGRALDGTDALLHAANVYSLNARDAALMQQVNVEGTRIALEEAARRGLDPIIHVSSCAALLPSDGLTATSPLGDPPGPYARSKVDAERVALEVRDTGAPIVITNPASVYGPHQPHVGESARLVRDMLKGKARLDPGGGFGVVDVRDVATAHARLFEEQRREQRYLMQSRWVAYRDLFRHLERVVGRRLPRVSLPSGPVYAVSRMADAAQRRGIDPGFSSEAVWVLRNWPPDPEDHPDSVLGVTCRPLHDTLRDTVAWLHERGLVSRRQAGDAAGLDWTAGDAATPEPV
ncbi:NAD-dependent epimerase/dehydratase family protein [Nitriliruptor alkaliphilus]|uniref:NAD-dependent epimerase/dehydratase family protein n=1 Tax=Nitriliruptor alkaliphilus TaxID=427918 RepID=UPI000697E312|nr:NAD-dependent epimerase/dehydratase family protein [Nitriliruptor alkaliphilus]